MTKAVKRTIVVIVGLSLLAAGSGLWLYRSLPHSSLAYIDPSDQDLVVYGKQIYADNCASCHGANLTGQPNWRIRQADGRLPAPPHDETGHTWHHPDAVLIDITKNGLVPGVTAPSGYVSDMPAYRELLSEHDIRAVIAYIKSSWPEHALAAQKDITEQSRK